MRIIVFITDGQEVHKILAHIGADSQAPRITPMGGPPLWEDCGTPVGEGVEVEPDGDISTQIAPDYQADSSASVGDYVKSG